MPTSMEKRQIGSLSVSVVGVGCNNFGWRIDAATTRKVMDAALEAGINFFDTADAYGDGQSEEFLGQALRGRRERAVIATKFGMRIGGGGGEMAGAKPSYVRSAAEASLRRLGVDSIDLYQLHWPDPNTSIGDTLDALADLVKAGKVREIGCSNFSAAQLREAQGAVKNDGARFVSVQNDYSVLNRDAEREVLRECARLKMAFLPYFPLASGLLTGKYRKGKPFPESSRAKDGFGPKLFTDENLAIVERLIAFAESRGRTLLELAVGYLTSRSEVASVIAGATSIEQVKANASATGWRLSEAEIVEVARIVERPVAHERSPTAGRT